MKKSYGFFFLGGGVIIILQSHRGRSAEFNRKTTKIVLLSLPPQKSKNYIQYFVSDVTLIRGSRNREESKSEDWVYNWLKSSF